MSSNASNTKRSSPISTGLKPRSNTSSRSTSRSNSQKTPRASPSALTALADAPEGVGSTGSMRSATKKVKKVVRRNGGGGTGGGKNKIGTVDDDEVEAGRKSSEEGFVSDSDDDDEDSDSLKDPHSAPRGEVPMGELLSGARMKSEPHKLSRGYEMIISPNSKPIIEESPKIAPLKGVLGMHQANHHHNPGRTGSIHTDTGFTDESDWEITGFEMDDFDFDLDAPTGAKRQGYSEAVKKGIKSDIPGITVGMGFVAI